MLVDPWPERHQDPATLGMDRQAMARRLTHRQIIEALGDMSGLARALGFPKANTVSHWKRPERGIPPRYWPAIERLAQQQGVRVTMADLEAGSPIRLRRAA